MLTAHHHLFPSPRLRDSTRRRVRRTGRATTHTRHGHSTTTLMVCQATLCHLRLRHRVQRQAPRSRRVLSPSLPVVLHSRTAHIELGILVTACFFPPAALGLRALLDVAVSSSNFIVTVRSSRSSSFLSDHISVRTCQARRRPVLGESLTLYGVARD